MADKLNGIDATGINLLIQDIQFYAEKINETLLTVSDLVDSTSGFFICENGVHFRQKFNEFEDVFPVIKKNILSYTTELANVKANYDERVSSIVDVSNTGIKKVEEMMGGKYNG